MKTRKEIAELAALLAVRAPKTSPHTVATDCLMLCRIAAAAQTIAVNLCNVPDYQTTFDKQKAKLRARLYRSNIPEVYSLRIEISGDPRGPVTRLFAAPGSAPIHGNTWGGDEDGYGI